MTDPYVGRLTYLRVYSGKVRTGAHVENSTKHKKERIGRILQMHANHREDMDAAFTGDIVAVVGLKHAATGDTLCDPGHPVLLEAMTFPTPVISVAIEPKTKADQDKLTNAMAKLSDEDPTFVVKFDDETGQTIMSGMGELHLEILVDRLTREFNVGRERRQAAGGVPRDDPQGGAQGRWAATSSSPAGMASTASWRSTSSPRALAAATSSSTRSSAGSIPREYIPSVDQGIQEALETRRPRRIPHGRRAGHADRRLVP